MSLCLGFLIESTDFSFSDTLPRASASQRCLQADASKPRRKRLSGGGCVNQTVPSGICSVHAYYTIEDLLIKSPKPKTVTVIPDSSWIPVSRQIIHGHGGPLSLGRKHHRRAVGFAGTPSLSPRVRHCAERIAHQDAMKSC